MLFQPGKACIGAYVKDGCGCNQYFSSYLRKAVKLIWVLIRYFFSLKGRISVNRYRAFLLWYALAVLPAFSILYFAFLALGWGQKGILRETSAAADIVATCIYFVGCLWPFVVATTRRMHDLGYKALDYFFVISPFTSWRLVKEILFQRGKAEENEYGPDPGIFE